MDTEKKKRVVPQRLLLYCISIAFILAIFTFFSDSENGSYASGIGSIKGGDVNNLIGDGNNLRGCSEGSSLAGTGKESLKGPNEAMDGGSVHSIHKSTSGGGKKIIRSESLSVPNMNGADNTYDTKEEEVKKNPEQAAVQEDSSATKATRSRGVEKQDADPKQYTSSEEKKWDPFVLQVAETKNKPEVKKTVTSAVSEKRVVQNTINGAVKEYATRIERGHGAFAREMGATQASEDAVDKGLAWLASVQNSDGHWNANGGERRYQFSYSHIGEYDADIIDVRRQLAATALEIEKKKEKYTAEKQKLINELRRVKEEENRKLAAKKGDILDYTTEEDEKNRQEYDRVVGKAEKKISSEIGQLTEILNNDLESAQRKTALLQNNLKQLISESKQAEEGIKGRDGILKGYRQLKSKEHDTGATGLALLAFMGAGHTHKNIKSRYRTNVEKGILWLLSRENNNGKFSMTTFYEQGIATMALCEAYGMTKDPRLKRPAQQAASFVASQIGKEGGYGYDGPGDDVHVTSFQVMALKSAILAGLNVSKNAISRLLEYYQRALNEDGTTGYSCGDPGEKKSARTAVGLFVRMFIKVRRTDPGVLKIANILDQVGPQIDDLYQVYDGTYAMFQMGGGLWKKWNERFRDPVIKKQNKNGSWNGRGGRVVATSFYIMSLEVYYRYLPVNR